MKIYELSLAWRKVRRRTYSKLLARDDATLIREVQARNGDALAVLFDRYCGVVFSITLRILQDRGEAEARMHRIFVEICQRAGQFDPDKGTFYQWLTLYAYQRSISRRNYLMVREVCGNLTEDELAKFLHGRLKVKSRDSGECALVVHRALAMLTESQKRTIEMVHFEGLTLKEVAMQKEQPFPEVQRHYSRGLARLRSCLRLLWSGMEDGTAGIDDCGASTL